MSHSGSARKNDFAPDCDCQQWAGQPTNIGTFDRWVLWKPDGEKKKPIDRDGGYAVAIQEATRTNLPTARADASRRDSWRVGLALTPGDGFAVVDGDDVRNPETGEVHPAWAELRAWLTGYGDVSFSGTGEHIVCLGKQPYMDTTSSRELPAHPDYPGAKVEFLVGWQLVAMTGNHICETAPHAHHQPDKLTRLWRWGRAGETDTSRTTTNGDSGRLSSREGTPAVNPTRETYDRLPDGFEHDDAERTMQLHVPGNQTVTSRWQWVTNPKRPGFEQFDKLRSGKHLEAGYINPKTGGPDSSSGELALARRLGAWYGRNVEIVQYLIREGYVSVEKYHQNDHHRDDFCWCVENAEWCITDSVSMAARLDVARTIHDHGPIATLTELADSTTWGYGTTQRAVSYFTTEHAVEKGAEGYVGTDRLTEFLTHYDRDDTPETVGADTWPTTAD